MEDVTDILNIIKNTDIANTVKVQIIWTDNHYQTQTVSVRLKANDFFNNRKLIYCLSYINQKYWFKGHSAADEVFNHFVIQNTDIIGLYEVLKKRLYSKIECRYSGSM